MKPFMSRAGTALAMLLPLAAQAATLTTLYRIPGHLDGSAPSAALLRLDGKLYGTTTRGGAANAGTVFTIDPATGVEKLLYSFSSPKDKAAPNGSNGQDGTAPNASLIAVNGTLYGTTLHGGASGVGTVFRIDPHTGSEKIIYSFRRDGDGGNPTAALLAYHGLLYGTTQLGGKLDNGYIYTIDPGSGTETTVYSFRHSLAGGNDGAYPSTALILHDDLMYGTTGFGGKSNYGTLYVFDPATLVEKTLHSFGIDAHDGQTPTASPIFLNGKLFGTTFGGGKFLQGTIFAFDLTAERETILHSFKGITGGIEPVGGLVSASGLLYGTTSFGGASGAGTVFSVDPDSGSTKILHDLTSEEGVDSTASLITENGVLYGTASVGGSFNAGTVFALDISDDQVNTLHDFTGSNPSYVSALIKVGQALYGTTSSGGANGAGSIFRMDVKSGAGKTLYDFKGGTDGQAPQAALLNVGGTLYGSTAFGGAAQAGTMFSFDPSTRKKTTLYTFAGGADGATPVAALVANRGQLYGTTYLGGASGVGTVFRFEPASRTKTTLHNFTHGDDGALPFSGVIYANGYLFGTTLEAGANGDGTIYKLDPETGIQTILHTFAGGRDGADPEPGLLVTQGQIVGGTTGVGTTTSRSTIFTIDPASGAETVLHRFGEFKGPDASLIRVAHKLFGTSYVGGAFSNGSVFSLDPATGDLAQLHSFTGGEDGVMPYAALLNVSGTLYGTTSSLDLDYAGTVFRLNR